MEDNLVSTDNNDVVCLSCEECDAVCSVNNELVPKDSNLTCHPTVGMSFASVEDVKSYYKRYSTEQGFGFLIRNSRKDQNGKIKYFVLTCSREGTYKSKVSNSFKPVPSIKSGCPAKITVSLKENDQYCINTVILNHSHEVSPTKARLFRSNKEMNMQVKRVLDVNDKAGVRMNKSFHSLVVQAGGYENLNFVERDCRNYIVKERRAIGKDGDGEALKAYFVRMQEQNNNFFYDIDLDDEFHVRNVFWADARSRSTYEAFGDVITFDTTYLTNKYDMPFAAFVGVNHHGQSVLLGCGLLSCEDTEAFVWLFKSWLRCMNGNPPKAIVTDQDKAMQNAIGIVFPDIRHRWCLWHILKKVPQKLGSYEQYKLINYYLQSVVYDTYTEEEFEVKWAKLIEYFDLHDNQWLCGLYEERNRWIPAFLKKYFWAGMSTTQRSESIHAFFDGYVHHSTSLQQFVNQYDNALRDKAEKEFEADFRSFNSTLPCCTQSPIEKQFQGCYTHSKFEEVQAEFRAKTDCVASLQCVDGSICTYKVVEDRMIADKVREVEFAVIFDRDSNDFSCKCLLFEFRGIVCRHSLSVLGCERVKQLPSKYILSRWSKNVKRRHTYIKSSYDVKQLKPQIQRFDTLCKEFYEIAELAAEHEDLNDFLQINLGQLKKRLKIMACSMTSSVVESTATQHEKEMNILDNSTTSNPISSPKRTYRKGRPTSKRKVSTLEKAIKSCKQRKKNKEVTHRTCNEVCNSSQLSENYGNNMILGSSLTISNETISVDKCPTLPAVGTSTYLAEGGNNGNMNTL